MFWFWWVSRWNVWQIGKDSNDLVFVVKVKVFNIFKSFYNDIRPMSTACTEFLDEFSLENELNSKNHWRNFVCSYHLVSCIQLLKYNRLQSMELNGTFHENRYQSSLLLFFQFVAIGLHIFHYTLQSQFCSNAWHASELKQSLVNCYQADNWITFQSWSFSVATVNVFNGEENCIDFSLA